MLMSDMRAGDSGVISTISHTPQFAKRLRDMGFCEGESVSCVRIAVFSSPILYCVKDSFVAIRRKDADKVGVSLEQ